MKTIYVEDRFRTNSLSLKPGGSDVKVIYSHKSLLYDKIKWPYSYVARIHADDIRHGRVVKILCNNKPMSFSKILSKARSKGW